MVDLDLRFIVRLVNLKSMRGSRCNYPPYPSMPIDAPIWWIPDYRTTYGCLLRVEVEIP